MVREVRIPCTRTTGRSASVTQINLEQGDSYSLAFDLYIIGSWDGLGRQAQQGRFGADIWAISMKCGAAAPVLLWESTFSNQKTVQQSYPQAYGAPGGSKYGEGSIDQNELGYTPAQVHVPEFTSHTNTTYRIIVSGVSNCATTPSFVMNVPNALQPGNRDESWGIDEVDLRVKHN